MTLRWNEIVPVVVVCLAACVWAKAVSAQRIPEPIDERQVEEYARLLDLSDDQRVIARSLLEQYMARYYDEMLQPIRAVHARERKVIDEIRTRSEENGENPGTLSKELFPPIMTDMARLAAEVLAFEKRFYFDNLEAILTEAQSPRMEHVYRRRELTIASRGIDQFELPEGDVNLVAQFESLTLSDDVRVRLDSEFAPTYESRLLDLLSATALVRRQWSVAYWDVEEIRWKIKQLRDSGVRSDDPEMSALVDDLFRVQSNSGEPFVATRRKVVEFNRAALAQLRELLPVEAFAELQDRIRRISYPKIWPDAGSAEMLFDAVLSRDDLADDLRAGITELQSAWALRHEMLSQDMAEQRMQEWIGGQRGSKEAQRDETRARKELEAIGHQREALNRQQQELLEQMLPAEMLAELPLRDWENNPPRRPWDPSDVLRRKRADLVAEREAYRERLKQVEEEFQRRKREKEQGGGGDGE